MVSLVAWGSLCMAHAAIRSTGTLIALRLLLGAAESGFTQTAFYYLSLMYPKFSLGLRMGLFTGMYSIAAAFAGLLAYALLHVETPLVHGWQVVFLVEGGLTVFMAIVVFLVFPANPNTAWFLDERERAHAVRRMERDLAKEQEDLDLGRGENRVAMRDILDVLKDWKKILCIIFNVTAVLVSNYLPFNRPPPSLPIISMGVLRLTLR